MTDTPRNQPFRRQPTYPRWLVTAAALAFVACGEARVAELSSAGHLGDPLDARMLTATFSEQTSWTWDGNDYDSNYPNTGVTRLTTSTSTDGPISIHFVLREIGTGRLLAEDLIKTELRPAWHMTVDFYYTDSRPDCFECFVGIGYPLPDGVGEVTDSLWVMIGGHIVERPSFSAF